jgi:hypothetical protein
MSFFLLSFFLFTCLFLNTTNLSAQEKPKTDKSGALQPRRPQAPVSDDVQKQSENLGLQYCFTAWCKYFEDIDPVLSVSILEGDAEYEQFFNDLDINIHDDQQRKQLYRDLKSLFDVGTQSGYLLVALDKVDQIVKLRLAGAPVSSLESILGDIPQLVLLSQAKVVSEQLSMRMGGKVSAEYFFKALTSEKYSKAFLERFFTRAKEQKHIDALLDLVVLSDSESYQKKLGNKAPFLQVKLEEVLSNAHAQQKALNFPTTEFFPSEFSASYAQSLKNFTSKNGEACEYYFGECFRRARSAKTLWLEVEVNLLVQNYLQVRNGILDGKSQSSNEILPLEQSLLSAIQFENQYPLGLNAPIEVDAFRQIVEAVSENPNISLAEINVHKIAFVLMALRKKGNAEAVEKFILRLMKGEIQESDLKNIDDLVERILKQ